MYVGGGGGRNSEMNHLYVSKFPLLFVSCCLDS